MNLIERYLGTVGLLLPQADREDILAELREALLAQREDRAAELGREPTEPEQEQLLARFGHPMLVAARYGGHRYVIGPELYPMYVLILKFAWGLVVVSALIVLAVQIVIWPAEAAAAIHRQIAGAWQGGLASTGAITLTFALVQRNQWGMRLLSEWSGRDLPDLTGLSNLSRLRRILDGGDRRWFEHVVAIGVQLLVVLWWTRVVQFWLPVIPLKVGQSLALDLAPVWRQLYWPVLGLIGVDIAIHALRLATPIAPRAALALDLVLQIGLFAACAWALRAGTWVIVHGAGLAPPALAQVSYGINIGLQVALIVTLCVATGRAALGLWRLRERARP